MFKLLVKVNVSVDVFKCIRALACLLLAQNQIGMLRRDSGQGCAWPIF